MQYSDDRWRNISRGLRLQNVVFLPSMFVGPICPIGWYSVPPYFNMCYLFGLTPLTFDQAVENCKANSATLATMDTINEVKLLANLLPSPR